MKKIWKKILISIESIVLFIAIGAITTAIVKNVYSEILVENFKARGEYDESLSSSSVKMYPIPSDEEKPTYTTIGKTVYPGGAGDIILSLKSELSIPFVKDFISFFAGGHASLVLDEFGDAKNKVNDAMIVETSGISSNYAFLGSKNYWQDPNNYKQVIVIRVPMTDVQRKKVISKAISLADDPYNYSFIADTKNKSYCSDLVQKAFASIGVNLNKDGFTTSVYDLFLSSESYISYYHYMDQNGIKHIYYLD